MELIFPVVGVTSSCNQSELWCGSSSHTH